MKKLMSIFLALTLLFCLCACGSEDPNAGIYTCTSVEYSGMSLTAEEVYEGGVTLELRAGGRGTLDIEGDKGSVKWSLDGTDFTLTTADGESKGTLENGVIRVELLDSGLVLVLVAEGVEAPEEQGTSIEELPGLLQELPEIGQETPDDTTANSSDTPEWWNGDWYGWWQVENSQGEFVDQWYDAFANLKVNSDGTVDMILWDEDFSKDSPMAEVTLHYAETDTEFGKLVSNSGYFYYAHIGAGEWIIDPDDYTVEDLIVIEGHHDAEGEDFDYVVFLRPWGRVWDDVDEDMLPYFYNGWYLPQIDTGEKMPDQVPQEVLDQYYNND